MPSRVEHTLFIELLGGVGDLLAALPAVHALGRSHPRARHDVLTVTGGELLVADPYVDRVVSTTPSGARAAVASLLGAEPYDVVVAETAGQGISELVERCGALSVVSQAPRPGAALRSEATLLGRLVALGIAEEGETDDGRVYLTAAEHASAARFATGGGPFVSLLVDVARPTELGLTERLAELGARLARRYGANVLAVGIDRKVEAARVAAQLRPTARAWTRGGLRELAAVLARVDVAVGADSSARRLAAAVGTRTVELERSAEAEALYAAACALERRLARRLAPGPAPTHAGAAQREAPEGQSARAPAVRGAQRLPAARPPFCKLGWRRRSRDRESDWRHARRLLIMRADGIGDVIMAGPVLKALKQALPDAGLTLLASPAGAPATALLPWLDATIAWPVLWQEPRGPIADPSAERRLVAGLEAGRFDGAIVLTGFGQTPHAAAAVAWLAGIPLRAGASRERCPLLTHAAPAPEETMHQAERHLDLLRTLGFPAEDDALELAVPDGARCGAEALLAAHGLPPGQPYVLVSAWAGATARTYEPVRMMRAAKLVSAGAHLPFVVAGEARDAGRAGELLELGGAAGINVCGQTSISELAALVAGARLLLTNNTFVMHMADALGTAAVVLCSGTQLESQCRPRRARHRVLRRPTRCSPCHASTCPLDRACLDIEPAEVADAALELLTATVGDRERSRRQRLR